MPLSGKELEAAVEIMTLPSANVSVQTFLVAYFTVVSGSVRKTCTYIDIAATWV